MLKTRVSSIEDFNQIVTTTKEFLLVKHSLTCPISTTAFEEYEKFVQGNPAIPTYYLFVQDDRPLSNYITETFSIKHESPQAIWFKDGKVVWNASHWNITFRSLLAEMKK